MRERDEAGGPVGIAPCLWFDDRAQEAAEAYAGIFPDSRIVATARYPEGSDNPSGKPRGSAMSVEVELGGQRFTLLNGGPHFTINPSISFFVYTDSVEETDRIVAALADGGSHLMEPGAYPWSRRYAWTRDRFGVSWQVMLVEDRPARRIFPCLMFAGAVHGRAEEALHRYVEVFPGSAIEELVPYEEGEGPEDTTKHGRATLAGFLLAAMDSHLAHDLAFNEGVSLQVLCRDQEEVDFYWSELTDGGQEGPCGWLKDRFGVSWQVVPIALVEMLEAGDGGGPGCTRAFQAMLQMTKLDLAALQAAYDGEPTA